MLRFSRHLICGALVCLALFTSAMDSMTSLARRMTDIDAHLKQIEKNHQNPNVRFYFNAPDIEPVLSKMKNLAHDLEEESKKGSSDNLTEVAAHYLTALGELHVLYARMAHVPGVWTSRFSYSDLNPFNLRLHGEAARPLVLQKPFNARHVTSPANSDEVEFFVTEQEKQMSEFLALNALSDEYAYEKMIMFVSVREGFTNLWALQRLNYSPVEVQKVPSCSTDLLSFRVGPNGDLRSSDAYQELASLDRYNILNGLLADIYKSTQDIPIGSSGDYYSALIRAISRTPEFKAYVNGVPPREVSAWLKQAADQVAKTAQDDWRSDAQNGKIVLGGATLIGDTISSETTAPRIAEAIAARHANAAAAEIARVATDNVKIPAGDELNQRIQAAVAPLERDIAQALTPKITPMLKDLDSPSDGRKVVYDRIQEKISETLPLAERMMPAMHDLRLITGAIATTDSKEEAELSEHSKAPLSYIRDKFQYVITDSTTFKTHLMTQLQQNSSLYKKLEAQPALMKAFGQFLMNVDSAMVSRQQGLHSPTQPQLAALLLQVAQVEAWKTLSQPSIFWSPDSVDLLKRVFGTINLLNARSPADLAPTTYSQRQLVEAAIDAAYTQNPLLSVDWKDGGFLSSKETLLEHLYDESWPEGKFPPQDGDHFDGSAPGIVMLAIQKATDARVGKLEDACQANLHDPKHDQRFRNMFLSASGLRQTLTHTDDADRSALLQKFDADLVKQTQTKQEAFMNRFINPSLNWVMGITVLLVIVMFFFPVTAPVLVPLLAVMNYAVMFPLSAASLYLRLSTGFYEQPAQLKYQDALASSQISAKDPFDDWEKLKNMGLVSNTTSRVDVEKATKSMRTNQMMTVAMLPMDIWYNASVVEGVSTNTGRAGFKALLKLFDGEVPAFAEAPTLPKTPSFRSLVRDQGIGSAIKTKVDNLAQQTKIIMGLQPVYGKFTSEEAANGLRAALSRSMPERTDSLLPEIRLYRDYLKGRLRIATSLSRAEIEKSSGLITLQLEDDPLPEMLTPGPSGPAVDAARAAQDKIEKASGLITLQLDAADPIPEFLTRNLSWEDEIEKARRFWVDAPELNGRLSVSEMMENQQIRKFEMIPRSLYQAYSEGRVLEWFKNYGAILKNTNQLRGVFITEKIARYDLLEKKIAEAVTRGEYPETLLANLSDDELLLFEEAARGPQWLTYGYWNSKLANLRLSSSPLKALLNVFEDYHVMLRSLRPIDSAPLVGSASPTQNPDQEDMRAYYQYARSRDGMLVVQPGAADGHAVQALNSSSNDDSLLAEKIEKGLYGP